MGFFDRLPLGTRVWSRAGTGQEHAGTIITARFDSDDRIWRYGIQFDIGFVETGVPESSVRIIIEPSIDPDDIVPPDAPPPVTPPVPPLPGETDSSGFIDSVIDGIKQTIENTFGGQLGIIDAILGDTLGAVVAPIIDLAENVGSLASGLEKQITGNLDTTLGAIAGVVSDIEQGIFGKIEEQSQGVTASLGELASKVINGLALQQETTQSFIGGSLSGISDAIAQQFQGVEADIGGLGDRVGGGLEGLLTATEDLVAKPLATLTQSLPLQIMGLKDSIAEALSGINELPEAIKGFVPDLVANLLNATGIDSLISLFGLYKQSVERYRRMIPEGDTLDVKPGSWDVPRGGADSFNMAMSALPLIGQVIQIDHAAEFERLRQDSFEWTRPMQLGAPDVLEYVRRNPGEEDLVKDNLARAGLSEDKIAQLMSLRWSLPGVQDLVDGWRRGFLADDELVVKLGQAGWQPHDIDLILGLADLIPPIQDLILFSVRGVFDVEESRRFGEFEGLPPAIEQTFIDRFGLVSGDFSQQVQIFADTAKKLGLPNEWVAAYWTSHWRLPSLQAGYEMLHRLHPDVVAAEGEAFAANGFDPNTIGFNETDLDRLVRSSDFSEYWRPKLAAIAFQPLTRVDIRRVHKLLGMSREWVVIQYRKIGYSPADAELQADFVEALNAEPDATQTDEVRALTRTAILDFVEHEIFTPEEGMVALQGIGYDEFAAAAFVDIEVAKRERKLQQTSVDLVGDQVLNGLSDLNQASVDLDSIGVPPGQKALILRELEVKLAKRTRNPSKEDLGKFLNKGIISEDDYRQGLAALGYSDTWIERYITLDLTGG